MKAHERKPPESREPEVHQPEDAVQDLEPDEQAIDEVTGGFGGGGGAGLVAGGQTVYNVGDGSVMKI